MQSHDTDQELERFERLKTQFKDRYSHDAFLEFMQAFDAMHDVYEGLFDDYIPMEKLRVVKKMLEQHIAVY